MPKSSKSSKSFKQEVSSGHGSYLTYLIPILKYCGALLIFFLILHNVLFAPEITPLRIVSWYTKDASKGSSSISSSMKSSESKQESVSLEPSQKYSLSESEQVNSSSSPSTPIKPFDPFAHMRGVVAQAAEAQNEDQATPFETRTDGSSVIKTFHKRLGTSEEKDDPTLMVAWGSANQSNVTLIPIVEDHLEGTYDLLPDPLLDRHCYTLGPQLDKHCVYTPMCIDPQQKSLILPTGGSGPKCSGFNRARQWLDSNCELIESIFWQEAYFNVPIIRKPMSWLKEQKNEQDVQWIDGLTLFQTLEASCANITDFAHRIMYINHILNNDRSYDYGHVDRILLFADPEVLKRFTKPAQYGSWHRTVFDAVLSPSITTTSNDALNLPIDGKVRFNAFVQSDIFDMAASTKQNVTNRLMCFDRAVVTSFLRERFFVLDNEYKSNETKLGTIAPDSPTVPKDAWKFRQRLAQLFQKSDGPNGYPVMRKRMLYLHRNSNTRAFDRSVLGAMIRMVIRLANMEQYALEVNTIEGMPISQIYELLSETAIFMSIHSRYLVNMIFAPPLSCLIEIFPFKYKNDIFVEGGFSGLKYYAVRVTMGLEWSKAADFGYLDTQECQDKNPECLAYYRDQNITLGRTDYLRIRDTIMDAVYTIKVIEREHSDHLKKARK